MRRREFIKMVGGAAGAWPLAARAQQDKKRIVGVVSGFSEIEMRAPLSALRSKLGQLGWAEGRNIEIDTRLGDGDYPQMTVTTGALVSRNPDVIVTMGCGDACPVYLGKRYLDWELTDPAGKSVEEVRPIVDEIDRRVRALLADLLGSDHGR